MPMLGTFHGSDLYHAFGNFGPVPIPTQTIQKYYISFVNTLDPNGLGIGAPLIEWPQYTVEDPVLVNFRKNENTLLNDTFRMEAFDFLTEHPHAFRI